MGTYTFNVVEDQGTIPGVTYDSSVKEVIVSVTDNNEGQLVAEMKNKPALTFTNTYAISSDASTSINTLTVGKYLDGREWLENESFTFKLEAADQNTLDMITAGKVVMPQNSTVEINVQNGKAIFDAITLKEKGQYQFKVTEVVPEKTNGVTYDNHEVIYTITVVDNLKGGLVASVVTKGKTEFTNTYATQPTTTPFFDSTNTIKILTGRDSVDDEFTFKVTSVSPESAPMPTATTITNKATVDGQINELSFGNVVFTQPGTYVYNVQEVIPDVTHGVTYDARVYTVTYEVTDNFETGLFNIAKKVTIDGKEVDKIEFNNRYKASPITLNGSQAFAGTKTIENKDPNAVYTLKAGDFHFEISSTNNAPLPEKTIVTNDLQGKFAFGDITYDQSGEYYYVIREVNNAKPGISYDTKVVEGKVTVTDDLNGKLIPNIEYQNQATLDFVNSYDPLNISASINGKKH